MQEKIDKIENFKEIYNMLEEAFDKFCKKILIETKKYYKKRLVSMVIFGSVGRKKMNFESDIDLLIIAENLPDGRMARVSEFERIEKKLEKKLKSMAKIGINTYLSPIFKTPAEVKRDSPIFLDMIYDSIILYDKNKFFFNYLKEFKKRLDKLGSKRIMQGDRWYWILKPDYKPGEVFEI